MKSVLVLLCLCAFTLANEVQEKWIKVHKGCQSDPDLFVPEEIFEKLKKGENPKLPPNFGAHAFCMLVDLGILNHEGDILEAGVREAATRSNLKNIDSIVHECSSVDDDAEPDDIALAFFGCAKKHRIDIGQF